MNDRVFVSYSRKDSAAVLPAVERLSRNGLRVWIDQSSIPASVPWFDEIVQAIRESVLVVAFESFDWHSSASCRSERRLAESLGKPLLYVDPNGLSPDSIAATVQSRLSRISEAHRARAELLGRSFRWSRGGRRRRDLARGRRLRVYRTVQSGSDDPYAGEFVRRSRRAVRIRAVMGFLVVPITLVAAASVYAVYQANDLVRDQLNTGSAALLQNLRAQRAVEFNPYLGLAASIRQIDENRETASEFTLRNTITSALRQSLPSAYDAGEVDPTSLAVDVPLPAPSGSRYVVIRSPARIEIHEDGFVTVAGDVASVDGFAWSPDGRSIAVADAAGVHLIDALRGVTYATLRGVPFVTGVVWRTPQTVQAGTADGHVATWTLAAVSIDHDPSWWFMDSSQASDGSVVALTRSGELLRMPSDGRSLARFASTGLDVASAVATTPTGWVVAGSLDGRQRLVEVGADGSTQSIPVEGCATADLDWAPTLESVVVLCQDGGYLLWNPPTEDLRHYRSGLVSGRAVVATDQQVLLVGGPIEVVRVTSTGESELVRLGVVGCLDGFRMMVAVPGLDAVFGVGVGLRGCAQRLSFTSEGQVDTAYVFVDGASATEARGLALSRDGTMLAVGDSNGTISIVDPDSIGTLQTIDLTGSEIRGVAFVDNDTAVIAVTRDGDALRVPIDQARLGLDEARDLAGTKLAQGQGWGLV